MSEKTCPKCDQPWPAGKETVGDRVRRLRIERDLTMQSLAYRCEMSPAMVAKIESGAIAELNKTQAGFLADRLDVTVEYLLTGNVPQSTEVKNANN